MMQQVAVNRRQTRESSGLVSLPCFAAAVVCCCYGAPDAVAAGHPTIPNIATSTQHMPLLQVLVYNSMWWTWPLTLAATRSWHACASEQEGQANA
jgi:hypothetical protein